MHGERVAPQSEVIRAILLEDIPCCRSPAPVTKILKVSWNGRATKHVFSLLAHSCSRGYTRRGYCGCRPRRLTWTMPS